MAAGGYAHGGHIKECGVMLPGALVVLVRCHREATHAPQTRGIAGARLGYGCL
jgi:hypothetical protein